MSGFPVSSVKTCQLGRQLIIIQSLSFSFQDSAEIALIEKAKFKKAKLSEGRRILGKEVGDSVTLKVQVPVDPKRERDVDFDWIVARKYVVGEGKRKCFDERDDEDECLEAEDAKVCKMTSQLYWPSGLRRVI